MLCGVLGCLCLIKSMPWRERKISLSGSEMEIFIHVCVVASGGLLLDIFLEDLLFLLLEIIMLIIIIMKHL